MRLIFRVEFPQVCVCVFENLKITIILMQKERLLIYRIKQNLLVMFCCCCVEMFLSFR